METIDFTKKWEMADAALKTSDSSKLLHVNKTILAVHSSYFKVMFFGEFVESKQDVVEIEIANSVLLEILKIIHQVNRNFGITDHKLYSAKMLTDLYRAADCYDIPIIRQLCSQQFTQIAPKEAFEISIELELWKEKSEILKNMSFEDIENYLNKGITKLVLSPVDVAVIVEKCKEAEEKKIHCPYCHATDCVQDRNYSNNYYRCSKCNNRFQWNPKNKR